MKLPKGILLSITTTKLLDSVLQPHHHFSHLHSAQCMHNERRTMFALQKRKRCHSNDIINSLGVFEVSPSAFTHAFDILVIFMTSSPSLGRLC